MMMELSHMSYIDILKMPVYRVEEYLNWKMKFDSDRAKAKTDGLDKIRL
jgi:hypothetical protein